VSIIRNEKYLKMPFTGYTYPSGRKIDIYPNAFLSPEKLIRTLGHERAHQVKIFGKPKDLDDHKIYEGAARELEDSFVIY
jgi:hypothetical protein